MTKMTKTFLNYRWRD